MGCGLETKKGLVEYFGIVEGGERGLERSREGKAINGIPMGRGEISCDSEGWAENGVG